LLVAIIGGALIWNQNRTPDPAPTQQTPRPLPKVTPPPPPATAMPAVALPVPATTPSTAAVVIPGSVNETPATIEDIIEDLSAVDSAIRNFQAVHGENPIGSNTEITGALLGNNLKQIKLEVPAGSHVNGEGQMCDRWGTPYFFHQVSKTEMEIRSAGPDRRMWTGDDSQL
jgi:hypothetical protein